MATIIIQEPGIQVLPVGQPIVYTVTNAPVIANTTFTRVKFVAEVYISDGLPPNTATSEHLVGTFKTTPNGEGVGMFDFRNIVENYLSSDNKAKKNTTFKDELNKYEYLPIHLVDRFSRSTNSFVYLAFIFKVEYIDNNTNSATYGDLITAHSTPSILRKVFNGYLKHTDPLVLNAVNPNNFAYNTHKFGFANSLSQFLTNAPVKQYANVEDYGTVGFLNIAPTYYLPTQTGVKDIQFRFFDENDVELGNDWMVMSSTLAGGFVWADRTLASNFMMYAGVYPANLQGWSSVFNANIDDIAYYDFFVIRYDTAVPSTVSKKYRININCPTLKGYEPIRLAWLNQWGAWDYYTFNMKSTKSISTKGSTYQQLEGTWNKAYYKLEGFKGGKKTFRVNATEKITMNTDFVNEEESEWFEELINSPEVYIVEPYSNTLDITTSIFSNSVIPVRLNTSSHTRKTVANDKLIQYTFEVEKAKTLRTQSV